MLKDLGAGESSACTPNPRASPPERSVETKTWSDLFLDLGRGSPTTRTGKVYSASPGTQAQDRTQTPPNWFGVAKAERSTSTGTGRVEGNQGKGALCGQDFPSGGGWRSGEQ